MTVELRGFPDGFFLGMPLRTSGYVLLVLGVLLVMILLSGQGRRRRRTRQAGRWSWAVLLILLTAAPLLSQVLLLRFPGTGVSAVPGLPVEVGGPTVGILAAVPWVLAGGMLGVGPATLVGLAGGLARGGWETYSLLTPIHAALVAALVARLLRQDYREWPGRLARHPLGAGLAGGLALGLLRWLEVYAATRGTGFDAFVYALGRTGPEIGAGLAEVLIGAVLAEIARTAFSLDWYKPAKLVTGPYNRSLSARLLYVFIALGLVAGSSVVVADWALARAFARQLTERQMAQTAAQAGESIPFFVQTGRSLMGGFADDLAPRLASGGVTEADLEAPLRTIPFFRRLGVFDADGRTLAFLPPLNPRQPLPPDLEAGVSVARQGVPDEVLVLAESARASSQLVFLWPIRHPETGSPIGVASGWVELVANPMFQPSLSLLSAISPGEGFIIDDQGAILAHPDPGAVGGTFSAPVIEEATPYQDIAPDGTPRLVAVHAVDGYPWRVVVTTPLSAVDMLGVRITLQLVAVLAIVGLILVAVVNVGGRRLTLPLRQMAGVAEAMARGSLGQPVAMRGDDEIGRLAMSFERMRQGLKARLDEMDLLLAASQKTASSFDLDQVLPPILEGVQRLTRADLVRLTLHRPDGRKDEPPEAYQIAGASGHWGKLDRQILDLCRERGKFMLVNPSRARAVLDVATLEARIEALLALPMTSKEGFVGAFWLAHQTPHVFEPDEVNLLSILAGQLGVAVANARLYQRAEQERLRLAAILTATPEAVLVTDHLGRISLANPAAETILHGPADQALGKPAVEWVVPAEIVELLAASGEEVRTAEVEVGGGRVMYAAVSDIEHEGSPSAGRVCVLGDITHYKKLDKLKSDFVSTVSHDLRAPLTLMKGYGTMLSMVGDLTEKQQEFVRKILDSVEQMAHLIDNLLDLGRIEAGVGLSLETVGVETVVSEVVETFRPHAANKRIALELDLEAGMEPMEADPTLLRQALTNLVDNALKYTPPGGRVVVHAGQQAERQLVSVQDTGGGIAPADQVRLFEKFFRAKRRDAVKEKGSGLGLAIVKSIAEQHGGRVSVESRLGAGSTFTLDLPLHPVLDAETRLDKASL